MPENKSDPQVPSSEEGSSPSAGVSLLGKLIGGIGTALTFVLVFWISNTCTGRGNLLFPPNLEVLKEKYAPKQSSRNVTNRFPQSLELERHRVAESGASRERIRERVNSGEDLLSVIVEESRGVLEGASTMAEALQLSGFWEYLSESEKRLVRQSQFQNLPGGSSAGFFAQLRIRRFRANGIWRFMSKERQELVGSTAFDQLSEQEQVEWGQEMLIAAISNGWKGSK